MNFLKKLFGSTVPALSAVLVALVWSGLAFCGEIHDAAKEGNLERVKALLTENPDLVSSKDDLVGNTPLHWAAFDGHKDVAEFLLANKAKIDARNKSGLTPLHIAAAIGHKNMAELLLANKAEGNAKGYGKVSGTPLHAAAGNGHREMVDLLLANKVDVNAKDDRGFTPLHLAANKGSKEVAQLLLANKADVNARTITGLTPLGVAVSRSFKDLVQLLREYGGRE